MNHDGAIPLAVESPAGHADLIVDGTLAVAELLPALVAATGVPAHDQGVGWVCWEGQRRLDGRRSLAEQGVVAGSGLWLTRGQAAGSHTLSPWLPSTP